MAQLDGEKIERKLFEEGFEFEQHLDPDTLVRYLKIYAGSAEIRLSEIWEEGDNWYVDTLSLNIVGAWGDMYVDIDTDPIHDEDSLVLRIVNAVAGELEIKEEMAEYRETLL